MTHKERILMAVRGELPDVLPYVPRFDLWYNANSYAGTLPKRHQGRSADEIARAEGWAIHKVVPELLKVSSPEENMHRGIGLYSLKENGYRICFSPNVQVHATRNGDSTRVQYHTPVGTISVAGPSVRMTDARIDEIAPMLLASAKELSACSGSSPMFSVSRRKRRRS